jgi:hypothetical protein
VRASGQPQTELKRFAMADSVVVLEKAVAALTKNPRLQRGFLTILNPWATDIAGISFSDISSASESEESSTNLDMGSVSTAATSQTSVADDITVINASVDLPNSMTTDEPVQVVVPQQRRYSLAEWFMIIAVICGTVHLVTMAELPITIPVRDAARTAPLAMPPSPVTPSIVKELWDILVEVATTTKRP